MKLFFHPAPAEVEGEEIFTARHPKYVFIVQSEPHRDDWAWIVLDGGDNYPIDLGASVPTKDAAIEACEKWLELMT